MIYASYGERGLMKYYFVAFSWLLSYLTKGHICPTICQEDVLIDIPECVVMIRY